jgi:hypothetical protein
MHKLKAAALKAGLHGPAGGRRLSADETERALRLTHDANPRLRQAALMNLCPCHVKSDLPEVWDRVFEMAADPDRHIRRQVLHTLGDGSPRRLEGRVVEALEAMRLDPDPRLRRNVRRLLAQYRRTGQVNVL